MKIAIASLKNPRSIDTWSGIPANIIAALERRGHEVIGISLLYPKEPWYFDWLRRIHYNLSRKWFLASVEEVILRKIGEQFDAEVENINPDIVLVIHGDFLSYSSFKHPSIIIHDTTFASLVNYYPEFTNLTARSIRAGNEMYQRALTKAAAAIFSAEWASNSATKDYAVDKQKVFTIPFGANISEIPSDPDVEGWILNRSLSNECNFLFLGVKWERKGGADAVRFIKALHALGIPSQLIVVGCEATFDKEFEQYVKQIGFLKKDDPEERRKLECLFQSCQALLLPSLAECFGCVYCEANAYGLPALGRDTGGIPEIIKQNINGLLLMAHETPEEFAKRWANVWMNKDAYKQMSNNARKEFNRRLNYDVFAGRLEKVILGVLSGASARKQASV